MHADLQTRTAPIFLINENQNKNTQVDLDKVLYEKMFTPG